MSFALCSRSHCYIPPPSPSRPPRQIALPCERTRAVAKRVRGDLQGTVGQVQDQLDEVTVAGWVDDGDEEAVTGHVDGATAAGAMAIDDVDIDSLPKASASSVIGEGACVVHDVSARRGAYVAQVVGHRR